MTEEIMAKRWIFTYIFCRDLEKMKWFYEGILQLDLIWESEKTIAFKIGDHQLSISEDEDLTTFSPAYSQQLGWEGGTESRTSWSLECDAKDFKEIVRAVKNNKIPGFFSDPVWKGY
jgi:catechol 2,3-dioxygenase-like lactoylglutathione lyase family enzyme